MYFVFNQHINTTAISKALEGNPIRLWLIEQFINFGFKKVSYTVLLYPE